MYVLSLEVVNDCNLNCLYCYLGEKRKRKMSYETAKKAVDRGIHEAKKQYDHKLSVYFIGGEPLLVMELIQQVVTYTKENAELEGVIANFSITTNGTLLTERIISYFIQEKFQLKISIDGDKITHDKNRKDYQGNGSYENILSKQQLIQCFEKETNSLVEVAQVVTTNTVANWYDNFIHLKSLGFSFIQSTLNSYADWTIEKMEVAKKELQKIMKYYYETVWKKGERLYWKNAEDALKSYFAGNTIFLRCGAGVRSIYVDVDGIYFQCKDIGREKRIGSTEEGLFVDEIRKYSSIQETKNEECLKCRYLKQCSVRGCVVDNYIHNKDIYKPVELDCFIMKAMFESLQNLLTEPEKMQIQKLFSKEKTV